MSPEFPQIRDVAEVVAHPVLLFITVIDPYPPFLLDELEGFQDGDAVPPSATQVIHLAATGIGAERLECRDDIVAVDIIPYLLPLIPEDAVSLPGHSHSDEIRKK